MSTRRKTLMRLGGLFGLTTLSQALFGCAQAAAPARKYEVVRTEEEWRKMLTADQYEVLRNAGTERAYTSPLDQEKRAGTFACGGCALPAYSSTTKFDSGTGWPSFYQPLANAVEEDTDFKLGFPRTEVLCRRCGSHLGHVFKDGPPPTGLRYCMNGLALQFTAA